MDIDYYYDEPASGVENLNWNPEKPSGYGHSLDLQLTGQLSLRGYDILEYIRWKDIPSTRYSWWLDSWLNHMAKASMAMYYSGYY